MEEIDRKILNALQQNADITNAALAEQVNLSPSSCLRRVQRLKQDGVISRIVAVADAEAAGRGLTAIVNVFLERHGNDPRRAFFEGVVAEPAIRQAYSISGEIDVVLVMQLTGMKEYQAICDRLFQNDPNVIRYSTNFVLDTLKFETSLPV